MTSRFTNGNSGAFEVSRDRVLERMGLARPTRFSPWSSPNLKPGTRARPEPHPRSWRVPRDVRSTSTLRMRKLRARRRGQAPASDGRPCFTRSDAIELRTALERGGVHCPLAFTAAAIRGLNRTAGHARNPKAELLKLARRFARQQAKATIKTNPVDWLNLTVAQLRGDPTSPPHDLSLPRR